MRNACCRALQEQRLADLELAAGQLVPALQVPNRYALGLGDVPQVVAGLHPIATRSRGRLTCNSMQQLARRLGIATGGNAEYLTDAQRVALESIDVANDIDGEVVTVGDRPQRIAGANLILLPVDQLLGLHQGEVGRQHLGFLHGYEQLLRAVQGDPPGERRVQLVELVLV